MLMSTRPWMRGILAALVGAGIMIAFGQLAAFAGGSCALLCRPPIAGAYGAIMGLLLLGTARQR